MTTRLLLLLWQQIEDLQLNLSRMEKEHGRREDILRQEISDLQQVLADLLFVLCFMCLQTESNSMYLL